MKGDFQRVVARTVTGLQEASGSGEIHRVHENFHFAGLERKIPDGPRIDLNRMSLSKGSEGEGSTADADWRNLRLVILGSRPMTISLSGSMNL